MTSLSRSTPFRRTLTGVALLGGPVLFAAAEMTGPTLTGSSAQQVQQLADHRGEQLAASLLSIASALVLLIGVLGAVHLVRRRGVTLAHLAALFTGYGLIAAHAALGGVNLMFFEMGAPGRDRAAMVDLHDHLTHDAAVGAPLMLGHYTLVLGVILLGIALWRGGVGPRWAASCVVLFPLSDVLLSAVPIDALADWVSNGFGIVGLGALGVYVLRLTDDQWRSPSVEAPAERTAVVA
jgi:hypothetical protein